VFALLINDQVMKCGTAGSKESTLRERVRGIANCGNEVWPFEEGRPVGDAGRQQSPTWDKFNQEIPAVIRSGKKIEVWAGAFTATTFEDKRKELNAMYNAPWVDRGVIRTQAGEAFRSDRCVLAYEFADGLQKDPPRRSAR
jgi:hypothetical protein